MKQGGHVTPGPAAAAGLLHGQPGLASGHQAGLAMGAVQPFSRPSVCFARGIADGTYRARGDGGTTHGGADRRVEQVDDGEVPARLREAHLVADQRARDLGPTPPPSAEAHTLHRRAGLA